MAAVEACSPVKYFSGFSIDINWRATRLVTSLQRLRSCTLCGVVPNETKVLPCSHAFCASCFDAVQQKKQRCPVDGANFTDGDVNPVEFPEQHLFDCQAHCWNADNGCQFVGSLLDVSTHFRDECFFHHVTCTRCHSYVLRRNILEHYEGGCERDSLGSNPSPLRDISRSSKAVEAILTRLAHIQAELEDGVDRLQREVSTGVRDIKSSVAVQTRQLTDIKEKQQELHRSCSMSLNNLNASVHSVPGAIRHRDLVKTLSTSTVFNISSSKVCWVVPDVEKHRDDARHDKVQVVSDKFMLSSYSARLSVIFFRRDGVLNVHVFFNICRGPDDDSLQWPFNLPVRMYLIHPRDRLKTKARAIDPASSSYPHCYYRPVEESNTGEGGVMAAGDDLEEFITSDSLVISAEIRDA